MSATGGAARLALVAFFAVLVGSAHAQGPTASSRAAANGVIAFQTDRDRNLEIYVVNVDGSNPLNLTNRKSANDIQPAWSPDGRWIAFASNRSGRWQLYVMRYTRSSKTKAQRLLVTSGTDVNPAWSPDGTQIAFEGNRKGNWDIFVVKVKASSTSVAVSGVPSDLTKSPGADDRDPSWSPKSDKLVFTTTATQSPNWNLATVTVSSQPKQTPLLSTSAAEFRPEWSSTGRIFFSRLTGRNYDVYWTTESGRPPVRITTSVREDANPAASSSGKSIAFTRGAKLGYDIYVSTADGGDQTLLVRTRGDDMNPAWQPGAERALARTKLPNSMRSPLGRTTCYGILWSGTAYPDSKTGGCGSDTLKGLGGADILTGGGGRDYLYGDGGGDSLYARDSTVDGAVDGGDGTDCAVVDPGDPYTSAQAKAYC
jgi:Tol biopolymer transport system component